MALSTTQEIIADIKAGKMVILMDDEDRENEGDLIMAASCVRPEDINFMARYGRGLICLTLTRDRCKQLALPLMVDRNNAQFSTAFTVTIEAAEGVTTGISAADRAVTVQAAVAPDAKASDLVQPGHIFPLMAQDGGVLTRAGHTEAGCDLARLAGYEAASVIVEILNEDGTMRADRIWRSSPSSTASSLAPLRISSNTATSMRPQSRRWPSASCPPNMASSTSSPSATPSTTRCTSPSKKAR